MTIRKLAMLGAVAALPVICLSAAAGCRTLGPCGLGLEAGDASAWIWLGSPLLLLSIVVIAWIVRFALTGASTYREIAGLRLSPTSLRLARVASRAGIKRIRSLDAEMPLAFCAGVMRPTVYVSEGALSTLQEDELLAVLYHEADHARHWEPAWRGARSAAAQVLSFLPIVRWFCERGSRRSEIAADIAAEQGVGSAALAGALLVMTPSKLGLAAFAGYAEMRARRLLGLPFDEPHVPRATWATTLVRLWIALSLVGCVLNIAVALR